MSLLRHLRLHRSSTSSGKPEKEPTKPCPACGESHWLKNCPFVVAAKSAAAKKAKSATSNIVFSKVSIDTAGVVLTTRVLGTVSLESDSKDMPTCDIFVSPSTSTLCKDDVCIAMDLKSGPYRRTDCITYVATTVRRV